jgi:hypothetical protein
MGLGLNGTLTVFYTDGEVASELPCGLRMWENDESGISVRPVSGRGVFRGRGGDVDGRAVLEFGEDVLLLIDLEDPPGRVKPGDSFHLCEPCSAP